MTDRPTTPGERPEDAQAAAARRVRAARDRVRPRRRHPAQRARIAAVGMGASAMAGLVGLMGYNQPPSPTPSAPAHVAVATQGSEAFGPVGIIDNPSTAPAGNTTLTARPSVRPAPPTAQAPAASTRGSN